MFSSAFLLVFISLAKFRPGTCAKVGHTVSLQSQISTSLNHMICCTSTWVLLISISFVLEGARWELQWCCIPYTHILVSAHDMCRTPSTPARSLICLRRCGSDLGVQARRYLCACLRDLLAEQKGTCAL